jgi:hypothetical protein
VSEVTAVAPNWHVARRPQIPLAVHHSGPSRTSALHLLIGLSKVRVLPLGLIGLASIEAMTMWRAYGPLPTVGVAVAALFGLTLLPALSAR